MRSLLILAAASVIAACNSGTSNNTTETTDTAGKSSAMSSDAAKDTLLKEGLDFKYGARHLKRSVERFLVYPLSNLVATGQIGLGDLVHVDLDEYTHKLIFSKSSGGALIHDLPEPKEEEQEAQESLSGGVGLPIPQATKAAKKSQGRGEKSES